MFAACMIARSLYRHCAVPRLSIDFLKLWISWLVSLYACPSPAVYSPV